MRAPRFCCTCVDVEVLLLPGPASQLSSRVYCICVHSFPLDSARWRPWVSIRLAWQRVSALAARRARVIEPPVVEVQIQQFDIATKWFCGAQQALRGQKAESADSRFWAWIPWGTRNRDNRTPGFRLGSFGERRGNEKPNEERERGTRGNHLHSWLQID